MAKLILSSCDFRDPMSRKCIVDHLPFPIEQCRVLFFPNEKATAEAIKNGFYVRRLSEFGFQKENITVFDYFSREKFDENAIIDVIYISGGNTFGTLKRIRESGADKIIAAYVKKGASYIGGSAGAHIASANIAHVEKYDGDMFGVSDFSGLGLFDGILVCHYTDARHEDYERLRAEGKYRVVALGDADSMVIEIR